MQWPSEHLGYLYFTVEFTPRMCMFHHVVTLGPYQVKLSLEQMYLICNG
jgi:hypothetical protein